MTYIVYFRRKSDFHPENNLLETEENIDVFQNSDKRITHGGI